MSLRTASGLVTDANADDAIDVYAQSVDFHGGTLPAGSAQVLEVSAPLVRVDAGGGLVLRESGTDGRTYYNVLRGGVLEQALVAVGASQRVTADPETFVSSGGLLLGAGAGGGVGAGFGPKALALGSLGSFAPMALNTQVQGYLSGLASGTEAGDPGLTLSQRLQSEGELSFASGQSLASTGGVDYWTESLYV